MAVEAEPNNTLSSANSQPLGTLITGALPSASDVDFFSVVAASTGALALTWDGPTTSAGNYFAITVRTASGTTFARFLPITDGVFEFATVAGETYYISIARDALFSPAQYRFWVGNAAPTLAAPIADQATAAQQNFGFVVPATAFADIDGVSTLSYSASMADGSALPSWLVLNAVTRAFSGTPSLSDVGALDIRVTATDNAGLSASDVFRLTIATDDFAANANTTGTLASDGSVVGNLSLGGDKDWFAVELVAGTPYRFDLRGVLTGHGTLVDPWLKLFSPLGTTLAADDDGASVWDNASGHSQNSQIVFRPVESGTYYLEANGYDLTTGTYTLSSQILANDYHISGVLKTPFARWNETAALGTPVTVTFSFPTTQPANFAPNGSVIGFLPMSEAQKLAAREIFQNISNFSGITFVEVAEGAGQIRLATSNQTVSGGFADWGPGEIGDPAYPADIAMDNTNSVNGNPAYGTYGYAALIHEIGHALGLHHPGDYNAGGGGALSPYLPTSQDATPYSVESYNFDTLYLDISPSSYSYATSMMIFDMAALQMVYGANTATNIGDNSYSYIAGRIFTIWDAAGIDTLDQSAWAVGGVTLNLCPGTVSYAGVVGKDTLEAQLRPRLSIAYDCLIENAIGTAFADLIIGNLVANNLQGGPGNDWIDGAAGNDIFAAGGGEDTLIGGAGDDAIDGGANDDVAVYSGLRSLYVISNSGLVWTITGPDGTDTLTHVEHARFADATIFLQGNSVPVGSVSIGGIVAEDQTLTATNDLIDADGIGLGSIVYQWQSSRDGIDWINRSTGASFAPGDTEVGLRIRVVASYVDEQGTFEQIQSAPSVPVVNINDLPTGSVGAGGTPLQGQTLSAIHNTLADADGLGTFSYTWRSAGNLIAAANSNTLVLSEAEVGTTITVTVSYIDALATSESITSSPTAIVTNLNDPLTGGVTIGGTLMQGETLTVSNALADLDGLGAISYQWKSDGANISGATGNTFELTEALVGQVITVVASYIDGHGTTESATSAASAAVANVNDAPAGSLSVAGTAAQGQTLTAANALSDVDGLGLFTYQWQADGESIGGANGASLVLAEAQVGKAITVTASYTDGHGTLESVTSGPVGFVLNVNDLPIGSVSLISAGDTPLQGQTLNADTSSVSDADGLGAFTYLWRANGFEILGAAGSAFTPTQNEVGKNISVVISYVDGHGRAEQLISNPSGVVANLNDSPTGVVSVAGSAVQGQTLLATNTLQDPDGIPSSGSGAIRYQWQKSLDGHSSWGDVPGEINNSLNLTVNEVGQYVRVVASYVDAFARAESIASSASFVNGPALSRTVDVLAYTWNTHALLDSVSVAIGNAASVTDASGHTNLVGMFDTDVELSSARQISSAESSLVADAVNLTDAIAILKMVVGIEVSGPSQALSPYQALAADFNGDGVVNLSDAIGVLSHVVGLPAPAPQWLLISESDTSIPARASLQPGIVAAEANIVFLQATTTAQVGLVGVLRGDVDGSFRGLPGTMDLDQSQPSYITDLIARLGLQASQFGVYGV
jgi:Putative Ig domain/Peptidase M10 serralysin C terminal/Bacterial pre-peptidase C-terminal domain